jgi:hypothetical protein
VMMVVIVMMMDLLRMNIMDFHLDSYLMMIVN